jgi:hypothetical protein
MKHKIEIGYQAFTDDSAEDFGAVRYVAADGKSVSVYVENAGDFVIPTSAVSDVQEEKVTFACAKLDAKLRAAIGHAHDAEDPDL